jgi:hypothetical protein
VQPLNRTIRLARGKSFARSMFRLHLCSAQKTFDSGTIEVLPVQPYGLNLGGVVNVSEGIGAKQDQIGALARFYASQL